ncbi:GntR family transcriptional regulator [Exiguobacterium sp. SH31]|uniref:GntR family transcriptional regulator n=2 Tax=unclassified Exiguobacterium TaxID=2644629 RepID=UPI0008C350F0|nr:GntR family transcriptional regulator [Exiguobacterium sp. SH31]OGX78293.1 GntR family transcriptional regulator [Exiguobacterium sp. SH31]
MLYKIDMKSAEPLYEQIVNQTKALVIRGILRPGDKVMSVRELATDLVINPNTVSKAYQELERLGLLEMHRGRGTFVSMDWIDQDASRAPVVAAIQKLAIDCHYANVSLKEAMTLFETEYKKVGENHADSTATE